MSQSLLLPASGFELSLGSFVPPIPCQLTEGTLSPAPVPHCPCTSSHIILVFTIVQPLSCGRVDSLRPDPITYSPNPCLQALHPVFWQWRRCRSCSLTLRSDALRGMGEEDRSMAESHPGEQVGWMRASSQCPAGAGESGSITPSSAAAEFPSCLQPTAFLVQVCPLQRAVLPDGRGHHLGGTAPRLL